MTFGGQDLYAGLAEKASAVAFSLIKNHPFIDGNKRVSHAALETFLVLNGFELDAPTGEQEQTVLQVASNVMTRDQFTLWVSSKLKSKGAPQP